MSMDPAFSANRISLLDRGFVYALIHARRRRAGAELVQAGRKLTHKPNSFNDFIDATQALIKDGYGQPGRIYAMGGSAGGLLMGAVINQAPQLYNAVVAQVPFVDVVTTMLDDSIPLTTGEYEEWGNPHQSAAYALMKSYSPYDNVRRQRYPNLLVTSGLYDSQVQYWEPAKWVAKLRRFKQGDSLLLLHRHDRRPRRQIGPPGAAGKRRAGVRLYSGGGSAGAEIRLSAAARCGNKTITTFTALGGLFMGIVGHQTLLAISGDI